MCGCPTHREVGRSPAAWLIEAGGLGFAYPTASRVVGRTSPMNSAVARYLRDRKYESMPERRLSATFSS